MRLLTENLLESAARWPHACAIEQQGSRVTYSTLARQAQALAAWLVATGVRRGDRVALLFEASADYVAAYYGTLLAGGVAVALNAAARAEELAGWIAHSESVVLILDGRHPEANRLCAGLSSKIRVLAREGISLGVACDELSAVIVESTGVANELPRSEPESLAALIYTSGTTGQPKAVMLSHANLAANTQSIVEYLHLSCEDSMVSVLPFYYSYGNSILHTHLASGARLILEPNLVYPHKVVETMSRERATGFAGVPSTFALLTTRVRLGEYDLTALRYLTQAGGPMSPEMADRVRAALPHAKLFVMYGQTEATARLSYLPPERLADKSGSVGIAIPGVELEVRADDMARCAPGVSGEIWARGRNVMLGYWRDEIATRAAIVSGWLRTGDSGRMDADGFLFIDGRRSDIIKVGAHRVNPHEVETVIASIEGVAEVAVVGVDDAVLGQVIKACIVASPAGAPSEVAVKAHCRACLASYKIPRHVEFVASLPRTSSGKVRRHLLAAQNYLQENR